MKLLDNLDKSIDAARKDQPWDRLRLSESPRDAARELRYSGMDIHLDPSLAPGVIEVRGQDRLDMCYSTYVQLAVEIKRRWPTISAVDAVRKPL